MYKVIDNISVVGKAAMKMKQYRQHREAKKLTDRARTKTF